VTSHDWAETAIAAIAELGLAGNPAISRLPLIPLLGKALFTAVLSARRSESERPVLTPACQDVVFYYFGSNIIVYNFTQRDTQERNTSRHK